MDGNYLYPFYDIFSILPRHCTIQHVEFAEFLEREKNVISNVLLAELIYSTFSFVWVALAAVKHILT